jgi:hypothetical protein
LQNSGLQLSIEANQIKHQTNEEQFKTDLLSKKYHLNVIENQKEHPDTVPTPKDHSFKKLSTVGFDFAANSLRKPNKIEGAA